MKKCGQSGYGHPCFGKHGIYHIGGRIHLPVAPKCNIKCKYCVRRHNCAYENRPGVTSRIMKPIAAIKKVEALLTVNSEIRVIGIAGPGDPLANSETFETLRLVDDVGAYCNTPLPLIKCISTNGLYLPECLDLLCDVGITYLTITINAVDDSIGKQIYSWVRYKGQTLYGEMGFRVLSANQLEGLREAVRRGMMVKVNSVLIPGINDRHLVEVAKVVAECGANIMNIMKLIPQGEFAGLRAPFDCELMEVQDQCELFIPQFRDCRQCRADAVVY